MNPADIVLRAGYLSGNIKVTNRSLNVDELVNLNGLRKKSIADKHNVALVSTLASGTQHT